MHAHLMHDSHVVAAALVQVVQPLDGHSEAVKCPTHTALFRYSKGDGLIKKI